MAGRADDGPADASGTAGWVPGAVRAAADAYARQHPPDLDDEPAGVRPRHEPEAWRPRWAVPWRVVGVAAVAVALLAGAAVLRSVALTPGAPVDLPEPLGATASATMGADADASAGAGADATADPTTDPATVVVHVVGAVAAPGVVRLPAGSRVTDAVAAAGGATAEADLAAVNLARVLTDGEQIVVPRPGDPAPPAGAAPGAADDTVDLNAASLAELDGLPGVGPVLAQRIVDGRPYTSVDELDQVSGIGQTLLERLRPLVHA